MVAALAAASGLTGPGRAAEALKRLNSLTLPGPSGGAGVDLPAASIEILDGPDGGRVMVTLHPELDHPWPPRGAAVPLAERRALASPAARLLHVMMCMRVPRGGEARFLAGPLGDGVWGGRPRNEGEAGMRERALLTALMELDRLEAWDVGLLDGKILVARDGYGVAGHPPPRTPRLTLVPPADEGD
jgi:hypothetical protein